MGLVVRPEHIELDPPKRSAYGVAVKKADQRVTDRRVVVCVFVFASVDATQVMLAGYPPEIKPGSAF